MDPTLLSVRADKCINILFPFAPCEGSHKQKDGPCAPKLLYGSPEGVVRQDVA